MDEGKKYFDGYTRGWFDFDSGEVCFSYWSAPSESGVRMVHRYDSDWYFSLGREDAEKVASRELDRMVDRAEEDGEYVKVFMPFYSHKRGASQRKELIDWLKKKGVTSLEADVNPVDRYMYDHQIEISTSPKILYFDLETDASKGGWEDISLHRILSVAYGTSLRDVDCMVAKEPTYKGEADLIDRFLDVASQYDILAAWNGKSYDEPVLKARAKKCKLYLNWRMLGFLDLLLLFKRYYMRDEAGSGVRISFALENIARTVLQKGKVEGIDQRKMRELLLSDPDKLVEYNKRDVELMIELERKMGYVESQITLARLCNRFLDDRALMSSHLVDGFVLKYAAQEKEHKIRFSTKHYHGDEKDEEREQSSFKGAYVMDPVLGMHEGVCDLDFSSLYPSIVTALNISPETKLGRNLTVKLGEDRKTSCAANGTVFRTDQEGVFPAICKLAMKARQEWKDKSIAMEREGKDGELEHRIAKQRSDAWKVLNNSMFGVLSSKYSRYADPECGEAITVTGATITKRVIELAQSRGLVVVYADTDSQFPKCTTEIAGEFSSLAEKNVDEYLGTIGGKEGLIKLKLDAEFLRIVFVAKKRYFGKKSTGKWDVRGMELIRSDGCRYMRELQRRIITFLLEAERPNSNVAKRIVEKWAEKLFEKKVEVEDLLLAQTLAQPIAAYSQDVVHVRVAKELLEKGREVYVGMKIPYVVVGKDEGRLKAVHVDDYKGEYDPRLYWKSKVYPATHSILEVVFPEQKYQWEQLYDFELGGPRQKDLFKRKPEVKTVVLKLKEAEKGKLQKLRDIVDRHPGEHPLSLELELADSVVDLTTGTKVKFVPELIMSLEKEVGRRIYFGSEDWDS